MRDSDKLFMALRPPPGGLMRLRACVTRPARRRRPWLAGAGGITAAALVLLWLLSGNSPQQRETRRLTQALQSAVTPPADGIQIQHGAALVLPSTQPNVSIYLVQTAPR